MGIYLSVFIIAYLCYVIGNKLENRIGRFSFILLAVLIPSLLAGFRDETVGTDLLVYAVPCFDTIKYLKGFSQLTEYIITTGYEPAYVVYTFIITRFTNELFWFFFIQMMICLGLVAYTCNRLHNRINAPLLYLVFLLYCYCSSLSYNRQVFATCIIFYGYFYLLERKLWKFVLCLCIAQLFHNSAIFAIFLYPLYLYVRNIGNKITPMTLVVIFGIGLLFVASFPAIISFLLEHGIINSKYVRYMNADYNTHKINLVFFTVLYFLGFLSRKAQQYNNLFRIFCISIIIMLLCGMYNDTATRVSLYFELFLFINILLCEKEVTPKKKLYSTLLLVGVFILFTYNSLTSDNVGTIPYTSKILNIK